MFTSNTKVHYLNPNRHEFTICGLWCIKGCYHSPDTNLITCNNCIRILNSTTQKEIKKFAPKI